MLTWSRIGIIAPILILAGIVFCLRANREYKANVYNCVPTVETTLRNHGLEAFQHIKVVMIQPAKILFLKVGLT